MRLGLFGGTFDPIHLGHLILAERCREACSLDQVWFVVANEPPHKRGVDRAPARHRLEMARLAIAGNPAFAVSEIETDRPGPSYSVDTLERVRADRPDDELFFLIGGDSLVDLPSWREPQRIARLATIVVVNRPGATVDPPDLGPDAKPFSLVSIPPIGISSSDIRRAIAEGRSVRYLLPAAVAAHVDAHRLYRPPAPASPTP